MFTMRLNSFSFGEKFVHLHLAHAACIVYIQRRDGARKNHRLWRGAPASTPFDIRWHCIVRRSAPRGRGPLISGHGMPRGRRPPMECAPKVIQPHKQIHTYTRERAYTPVVLYIWRAARLSLHSSPSGRPALYSRSSSRLSSQANASRERRPKLAIIFTARFQNFWQAAANFSNVSPRRKYPTGRRGRDPGLNKRWRAAADSNAF